MNLVLDPVRLWFEPRMRRDTILESQLGRKRKTSISNPLHSSSLSSSSQPLRYAVLGAGFAGLSVAWHLLQNSSKESRLCIDIYDEVGIGGGASGVAGGLLHPYSPKAKLLWRGAECWKECLELLRIAEAAKNARTSDRGGQDLVHESDEVLVWRRGILRPATALKNVDILKENAQNCLGSCRIEFIDKDAARNLVPDLCVPFNSAVYMPEALNIHPKRYLQALFLACQSLADDTSASGYGGKEIYLHKKSVNSLLDLAGEYSAVIICLGAKAKMLPELSGKLPLRTCRGVVTHLQLPKDAGGEYGDHSPSILSDAWFAVQGPRSMILGSTWNWGSRNYSPIVSADEASTALEELIPKASAIYPGIRNWDFREARAGVRAMPPLTDLGSLPLMGCVDDAVGENPKCRYWLIGGLGSRGLLYHGWLGKLMAQAVISCNEDVLPPELTSWKKLK
ncbi:FAD-dependent oxidoreductase family protein isoform X2 [Tasmannia lanceolata]|uniref:FAD-dependent oxidoreductase family protein isoform X2 n=1 Tax=Tasmannia lanceolata TaxID=3420 RepID=UPI0040635549